MRALLIAAALLASSSIVQAQQPSPVWVTLGTMGGPMPFATRSQPANALIWPGKAWLIDCGDGAVEQLAKAGMTPRGTTTLFLSHLHFDHTGGVAALIGLRHQLNAPGKLIIYGPPGTEALVKGIVASMRPAAEAGYGLPDEKIVDPAATVEVHELVGGAVLTVDGVKVSVVQNSHYSFAPGSDLDRRFKSLSYRFDLLHRSIVYTGDTGPSAAVDALGKGADLLVSEMIDVGATVAEVRRQIPNMPAEQTDVMRRHLAEHHLTPEQVGEMAARMGVRQIVVTHLAGPTGMHRQLAGHMRAISARTAATVTIANDLDRF